MILRDLIFSAADNRGVSFDRGAESGEYMRRVDQTQCQCFFESPRRYEWTGTALIEFSCWQEEQDAANLAAAQARVESAIIAEEDRRSWLPIEHPSGCGIFHKSTTAITETIHRFSGMPPNDPLPINNGRWDDVDGNPVPFTYQTLIDLRNAIYDRAAYNYGVRKYHVAESKKLSDPDQYDYSGGWA